MISNEQDIEHSPQEAYFEVGNGDYIKEWLIIGPFPRELDTDFLLAQGGEANIRPSEGMEITAPDGKTYTWKRHRSQADAIDLLKVVGRYDYAVAYAACNLVSPKDQQLDMSVGSDDGVKVWLNGELVHANPFSYWLTPDKDRVPVTLKSGVNRCLVKVDQRDTHWEFTVRFVDELQYLQSLRLEMAVRRQKRAAKDVLSITVHRVPKSTLWKAPELPVRIEIQGDGRPQGERPQGARLLATLQTRTGQAIEWTAPDEVQRVIEIVAKHTDATGVTHEAKFACQAHHTLPVAHRLGHWERYDATDGLSGNRITSIVQWEGLSLVRLWGRRRQPIRRAVISDIDDAGWPAEQSHWDGF